MPHPLHSLFQPQGIAVIGASDRSGSLGRRVFAQLAADTGRVPVPVNPNRKTVGGRTAYAALAEAAAAHPLDTAVVAVAAEKLPAIVKEAAKCGVDNLIAVGAPAQYGAALRSRLQRAAETASAAGIRLLSVSAQGLSGLFKPSADAACAYIGQSGDIADCMAAYADEHGVSFKHFLILNPFPAASVDEGALIECMAADAAVKSLLVHIGTAAKPRELISALAAAARRKPVIVLPTLSDPQEQELLLQALGRSRIPFVDTLAGFFTAAKLLDTGISGKGPRVALVSNAAQIGALTLNALAATTLTPARPSAATARALAKLSPEKPEQPNPCYLPADAPPLVIQAALEHCLNDEGSDAVLFIYASPDKRDSVLTARLAAALQHTASKPLFLVWTGQAHTAEVRQIFNRNKNLHFQHSDYALQALDQLNRYRAYRLHLPEPAPFHDYRRAAAAAAALDEHINPMLPVAVLPAGRGAVRRFLDVLGLPLQEAEPLAGSLNLIWEAQPPFGRVLTLSHRGQTVRLLPPVSSEAAAAALTQLDWTPPHTLLLLLDAAELFARLPEIHSCRLVLQEDQAGSLYAAEARLHLHEAAKTDAAADLYAPYPVHTEQSLRLKNGADILVRPVRPEDAAPLAAFFAAQSRESRQSRFAGNGGEVPPQQIDRLARTDYHRDFALLAEDADKRVIAAADYIRDDHGQSVEFGISIADDMQGQGLGFILMNILIDEARRQGIPLMRADILSDNQAMLRLAEKLGFTLNAHPGDSSMTDAHLPLPPLPPETATAPSGLTETLKARLRKQIGRS